MTTETTCPLALPLAVYATYGGEIYDPRGEMIANTWCLQCRNPDVAEAERRQVANARAAEIVRRVNLHDDLVEALRELRDYYTSTTGLPAAKANAVLAKVEGR